MSTSKRQKKIDDPRQLSIFSQIAEARARKSENAGAMRVRDDLRVAMNNALKECPLSRHQVAGQMSHFLNEEVTKVMLDAWTAESKSDRHIPAEYLPAFCRATGSNEPMEILNRAAGLFAMQGQEALRSEIHMIQEQLRVLQREKRKREQLLNQFGVES